MLSVWQVILWGVTTIPWTQLDPAKVEQLIAALLVRTVQGAKLVDGAGGDDGADVVAPIAGGEHVYQVKSFTGRLDKSRRRQILASLRTARDRRPAMRAWTLVVPTDLTPGEQRWFTETLAVEVGVPVEWIGRVALESAFAERPDLARNLLPGSAERLALEMLIQEDRETAALAGGVADAVSRGAALRALAGKSDPDWDFDLDLGSGNTTVRIRPKDPGAFDRSPIGGVLQFQAPPGSAQAQAISDFDVFGSPLQLGPENVALLDLQLPGGLGDQLDIPAQVSSLSISPTSGPPQRLQLVSVCGGRVVERLAMTLTTASQGVRGGRRLVLVDDAQVLQLELRIPPVEAPSSTGEVAFQVQMRPDRHPHDALPAIAFLAGLADCDRLRLDVPGAPPIPIRLPNAATADALAPVADCLTQLQALQRVQDATGVSFGVPALNPRDRQLLHFADRLLCDGQVEWQWPGAIARVPVDKVRTLLASSPLIPKINIRGSSDGVIQIGEHYLPLPGEIVVQVTAAVVVNPAALHRAVIQQDPPAVLDVHLGRQDNTSVIFRLEPAAAGQADLLAEPGRGGDTGEFAVTPGPVTS